MRRIWKVALVVLLLSSTLYYYLKFTRFSNRDHQDLQFDFNKGSGVLEDFWNINFIGEWESTSPDSVNLPNKEPDLLQYSQRKSSHPNY